MRDLFGDPEDGTFLAWFADNGVWSILIVVGAIAAWFALRWYIHRRLRRAVTTVEQHEATSDVGAAVRAFDRILSDLVPAAILALAAVLGILAVVGKDVAPALDVLGGAGRGIGRWLGTDGLRIVLIIVLGWAASRVTRRVLPRLVRGLTRASEAAIDHDAAAQKRSDTLTAVFTGTASVLIAVIVGFTILTELGVPVGPVLGGVGIAGIAIGFGAQHLVRDLITGIFIIAENQYRQGDVVEIAGTAGLVESINLRRTVLRDLDGKVHVIPHGEIGKTTNFTKYWSRVHLDVGVAYKEDMDHVFRVLNEIGEEIANDPVHGMNIIDPPKVLRLNSFDDSAITIKVLGVCKPMTQWEIMGEMRRRIKKRFDEEGIEIPFPHQTLYWGDAQPPLPWAGAKESPAAPVEREKAKPEVHAEDFVPPDRMTPAQREAALAEMAVAAAAFREKMDAQTAGADTEEQASLRTRKTGRTDEEVDA